MKDYYFKRKNIEGNITKSGSHGKVMTMKMSMMLKHFFIVIMLAFTNREKEVNSCTEELALMMSTIEVIYYNEDWIANLGCLSG